MPALRAGPGTKGELCTSPLVLAGRRRPLPRPSVLSAIPLETLERRGQTREPLPEAQLPKSAPENQHRASPLPVLSLQQFLLKAVAGTLSSLGEEDGPSTLDLGSGICNQWVLVFLFQSFTPAPRPTRPGGGSPVKMQEDAGAMVACGTQGPGR